MLMLTLLVVMVWIDGKDGNMSQWMEENDDKMSRN